MDFFLLFSGNNHLSSNVRFEGVESNGNKVQSDAELWSDNSRISGIGAQEVFVFEFGAAVFW
jgi:hypothetical protein